MAHESAKDRGHRMLREAGYASGGDVAQDRKMITKAIRQHETQEHGGKHSTLKLAKGGHVRKRADGGSTTDRAPIDLNPSELGAMENAAAVAEKRDRAQYPDKLHKSITSTYPAVAAQRIARKKYGQEDIGTVDDKRSVEIGDAFAKRAKKNADDEGPVYKPDDDYAPKGFKAGGRTKGKVQKRADGGAIRKPATTVNVIVAAGGKGQGASDETNMRRSIQAGMHAAPPAPPPMAPPGGPGIGAGLPPGIGGGPAALAGPAMSGAPLGAGPMPGMPPKFQRGGVIRGAPYQRRRGGNAGC